MNHELENGVERYLCRRVQESGGQAVKLDSKTGLPDRLIILPQGVVLFVETKRPKGGVLSSAQLVWLSMLGRLGHVAVPVRNKEEVDRLLREYTET